jgi:hypothetical protein
VIRALVGARKNWGGNRTQNGAHAQAVLTSLLQTAKQQGKNPFDVMVDLLCRCEPCPLLGLVPSTRATRGFLAYPTIGGRSRPRRRAVRR